MSEKIRRRTTNDIKMEQEQRALNYPLNRIAFRKDWNTAIEDQREMRRFVHGEIDMNTLCNLIRDNNHLPRVTETQMICTLKNTGWIK